jgi:hypothetical protein
LILTFKESWISSSFLDFILLLDPDSAGSSRSCSLADDRLLIIISFFFSSETIYDGSAAVYEPWLGNSVISCSVSSNFVSFVENGKPDFLKDLWLTYNSISAFLESFELKVLTKGLMEGILEFRPLKFVVTLSIFKLLSLSLS